jgi:RecA-family ATPase
MSDNLFKPNFDLQKFGIVPQTQRIIDAANQMLTQPIATHPVNETDSTNMFIVKPANHWIAEAKNRPALLMLFDEFWFEGEICILFADTNLGKSILAVQIGDSLSTGKPLPGFNLQTAAQPVLYFDFELTDKQFENRYSANYGGHYNFDANFLRVEISHDLDLPHGLTFEQHLYNCLERTVIAQQAKVLIIDNITYLRTETEKAKDALPLMKELKDLKVKYNLSMLILAHTPKRDKSKPISSNDLSGSKMLINFCDSAFTIGESSKDNNLRYLKQIKQRNGEQIYGASNVCICQISKPDNFLQFELIGSGSEYEHLKEVSENSNSQLLEQVLELHGTGQSTRQIGAQLGVSHMMVARLLKKQTVTVVTDGTV